MDSMFELLKRTIDNKITKAKLKNSYKDLADKLGIAAEYIKGVDVDKFMQVFPKIWEEKVLAAYQKGTFSDASMEKARRLKFMAPSELMDSMYNLLEVSRQSCMDIIQRRKEAGETVPEENSVSTETA